MQRQALPISSKLQNLLIMLLIKDHHWEWPAIKRSTEGNAIHLFPSKTECWWSSIVIEHCLWSLPTPFRFLQLLVMRGLKPALATSKVHNFFAVWHVKEESEHVFIQCCACDGCSLTGSTILMFSVPLLWIFWSMPFLSGGGGNKSTVLPSHFM